MGLSRSTFYDAPAVAIDETEVVARMRAICDEFENFRAGDPRRRRLRVVCEHCNTGWMSRLQIEAKPFLLPLIQSETAVLSHEGQRTVAT